MHFIRLRGPWQYEVLAQTAGPLPAATTGKQKLPADWSDILGADFCGAVRYRRVFHQPTGLEEGQQVWLSVEGVTSTATVTLNGTPLPAYGLAPQGKTGGNWRQEVQDLLLPTSELIIDVSHPTPPSPTASPSPANNVGGLTGLVQLEIQTVQARPVD